MSRSLRAHLALFCVVAVWGSTFVLVKATLRDITPLLFNLVRMLLAFLCLAIIYRRQWKHITPAGWRNGAVVGLCLAVAYQFQTAGLQRTTASKSAFITGMTLVLVPLFSALPGLRLPQAKRPAWNVWLGVLLAFTGVVLLTAPARAGGTSLLPDFTGVGLGDLLTLGCALAFSAHILVQDRVSQKTQRAGQARESVPFEQLALLQLGFCTLAMAVSTPLLEKPHLHVNFLVVFTLTFEAVFATAVAFTVQSWVQQFLAPTYLVLIYAMEPVFAWLTSLLFLREGLSSRAGSGAFLILAGVLVAELIGRKPIRDVAAAGAV